MPASKAAPAKRKFAGAHAPCAHRVDCGGPGRRCDKLRDTVRCRSVPCSPGWCGPTITGLLANCRCAGRSKPRRRIRMNHLPGLYEEASGQLACPVAAVGRRRCSQHHTRAAPLLLASSPVPAASPSDTRTGFRQASASSLDRPSPPRSPYRRFRRKATVRSPIKISLQAPGVAARLSTKSDRLKVRNEGLKPATALSL
jgi:hypothetical protein